jgi:hypothetical protein
MQFPMVSHVRAYPPEVVVTRQRLRAADLENHETVTFAPGSLSESAHRGPGEVAASGSAGAQPLHFDRTCGFAKGVHRAGGGTPRREAAEPPSPYGSAAYAAYRVIILPKTRPFRQTRPNS